MTERFEVTCITKRGGHYNPHERIQAIGGTSGGGWKINEDEAIKGIESRKWAFYVIVDKKEVDVVVATHMGRKYLKTTADGYEPNNLLSLRDCP